MENLENANIKNLNYSGEAVREFYRNQGRVQQYLRTKNLLEEKLCLESKYELCSHADCLVTLDIMHLLKPPGCITCYYPLHSCKCEDGKNRTKYPDNEQ